MHSYVSIVIIAVDHHFSGFTAFTSQNKKKPTAFYFEQRFTVLGEVACNDRFDVPFKIFSQLLEPVAARAPFFMSVLFHVAILRRVTEHQLLIGVAKNFPSTGFGRKTPDIEDDAEQSGLRRVRGCLSAARALPTASSHSYKREIIFMFGLWPEI